MAIENLNDLFVHALKETYYAEVQIRMLLPKVIEKIGSGKLRGVIEDHLDESERQIERLVQVFEKIGEECSSERCAVIAGVINETHQRIATISNAATLETALLTAAIAIERYEISHYSSLCTWAQRLGHHSALLLLEETLLEEKAVLNKLNLIAKKENHNPVSA